MLRILLILQHLFMLWMLVDAVRRRAEYYWFMVIFLPFGEWAYFFAVKIKDPEFAGLLKLFHRPQRQSVNELLALFHTTPSHANRLKLAQGLHDAGDNSGALHHFEAVLQSDPEDRDAAFGKANCLLGLGRKEEAVAALRELRARAASFRDYAAGELLAQTLWELGRREEAVTEARGLWKTTGWISHAVPFAHLVAQLGNIEEARSTLTTALREFRQSSRGVKRRFWRWEGYAKRLLDDLPRRTRAA